VILIIFALLGWLFSAAVLMIVGGIVHAQILPAVIPFGYGVALSLTFLPYIGYAIIGFAKELLD
jgi:hypothetical protein